MRWAHMCHLAEAPPSEQVPLTQAVGSAVPGAARLAVHSLNTASWPSTSPRVGTSLFIRGTGEFQALWSALIKPD